MEDMKEERRIQRLLILLDGSTSPAEIQLPWARLLALTLEAPVTLVHILDPASRQESQRFAELKAEDYLRLMTQHHQLQGVAVDFRLLAGLPEDELRSLAGAEPDALVMCAGSSMGGGIFAALLGDGPVLRVLHLPFIVVPPQPITPEPIRRIVVGTDRSPLAAEVLQAAASITSALGVELIEVESLQPGPQPGQALFETPAELGEKRVIIHGQPGPSLLAVARARDAQIIVVGSHNKGPLARLRLGSTSNWLAHNSDRPVLIVPQR